MSDASETDTAAAADTGTAVSQSAIPREELARLSDDIISALKTVYDPEIPADIYELGLIYKIDIEDDGLVMVSSTNQDDVNRAIKIIQDLTADVEVGKIYHGTVVKILDFGAFVEILPGKDGLCHISQLAPFRVNKVEDVVKMGDEIDVKVMEIDSMGRYNLSKKAADAQMAQAAGQTKTEETK